MTSALLGELVYLAIREIMALADKAHRGEITGQEFHSVVKKFSDDLAAHRERIDAELAAKFPKE